MELEDEGVDFNLREVCNLHESQLANEWSYKNDDSDKSEYVAEDDFERNVFDTILDDEDDKI